MHFIKIFVIKMYIVSMLCVYTVSIYIIILVETLGLHHIGNSFSRSIFFFFNDKLPSVFFVI
ncbi:hypothetical protein PUN28_006571 [Cardiocondyla obscurior]|uniref:Uncharacterized protein n=1 Tax=Cardiocondyla obscurior TaxID=286306 RepID=A0AAW2GE24_9HYME